eukprot:tig00020909_g15369.t1
MPNGVLFVKLIKGSSLKNREWFGKMDVFARTSIRGAEEDGDRLETVRKGGTSPDFAAAGPDASESSLHISNASHPQLTLELYDEESVKQHDFIGGCRVFLDGLLWPEESGGIAPREPVVKQKTLRLHGDNHEPAGEVETQLHFKPSVAIDPAEVRDPMAEEERAFSAQVDALVESYKAAEGPQAPRDMPPHLQHRQEVHPRNGVPLYTLDSPLQATVVDLNAATYERAAHVSLCGGHFVRVFLMHGRRELGRAEDEDMTAQPFHFCPPASDGFTPVGESSPSLKVGSGFMAGTSGEPYPCKRLPREAQLLVCVYCRRGHDEGADGPVKSSSTRHQARVLDKCAGGEPAVLVAWSSLQVFDQDGVLRTGTTRLNLWRQRASVPYSFRGKCENCLELEATVQCPDCRSKAQLLCDDCDAAHRSEDGMKGHRSTRLPTARQTQWGTMLLRIERPYTSMGGPADDVVFAFDPEEVSEEMKPFEEGLKRRRSFNPATLNVQALLRSSRAIGPGGPLEAGPSRGSSLSPARVPPALASAPSAFSAAASEGSSGVDTPSDSPRAALVPSASAPEPRPKLSQSDGSVPVPASSSSWSAPHGHGRGSGPLSGSLPLSPAAAAGGSGHNHHRSTSPLGSIGSAVSSIGRATIGAVQNLASALSLLSVGTTLRGQRRGSAQRTLSERLRDFVEKGNDPYWEVDEESREAIRANADLFTPHSVAFAKFIECLDFSRPRECAFVEQVVRAWVPITPHDALQLLDQAFPDLRIRRYAAERIGRLADEELADYMLQLVQGMRHASYLDSPLTRLLFWRGLRNPRGVGLPFLWALRWGVGDESAWGRRCKGLLAEFERACRAAGHQFVFDQRRNRILRARSAVCRARCRDPPLQIALVDIAGGIATKLIDMKGDEKRQRRERLKALIKTEASCLALPGAPRDRAFAPRGRAGAGGAQRSKETLAPHTASHGRALAPRGLGDCRGLKASASASAFAHPRTAAVGAPRSPAPGGGRTPTPTLGEGEGRLRAIFKAGQDLRTDELCLKMISVMDKLWKAAGLDLLMTPYKCVSTARGAGVIEVVEGAYTIGELLEEAGGSLMAFSEKVIADWLIRKNEVPYEVAQANFARSCAGYCVATYVLGLCDRHSDNVMLFPDGRVFHIDFGRFLGHVTKMGGLIPKETSPFLFTPDYAHVMGGEGAPVYEMFVRLCGDAFIILRRHRNLILHLCMLLHGRRAVRSIYERFVPELEGEEAVRQHFKGKIEESLSNLRAQFYNWCHLVKLSATRNK